MIYYLLGLSNFDDPIFKCVNETENHSVGPAESGLHFVLSTAATLARIGRIVFLINAAGSFPAEIDRLEELARYAQC